MATNNTWAGAVRYANGAVYFPNYNMTGATSGTFVMPDGTQIPNGPHAKTIIDAHNNPNSAPPVSNPPEKPDDTPGGLTKGGQPTTTPIGGPGGTGTGPGGGPPVGSPGGLPIGSKGGQPGPGDPGTPPGGTPGGSTPTPTTPPTDPFGPNFSKGQPAAGDGMSPNQYFAPFLQQLFGSGYNPYGGYPGTGGQQGGLPGQNNQAVGYDPLGIGQNAYMDPNASVYGMTGVNAVNGTSSSPQYGVVGGNGGYGLGFVGDEYTGPIWNDVPDINKLMAQRQQIMTPQGATPVPDQPNKGGQPAAAGGWGMNSPNQAKKLFAEGGGTKDQWRAQRLAGDPTTGGAPGYPPTTTPGASTAGMGPQGQLQGGGWGGYDPTQPGMLANNQYNTPFGELVQSSTGDAGIYKINGGNDQDLFQYDPTHLGPGDDPSGWKHFTGGQTQIASYGPHQYVSPFSDPNAYKAAGGQMYQYGTPINQAKLQQQGLGLPPGTKLPGS